MYHILICDDEKDIVTALKIYLSSAEYHFFEAYDGEQALEIIRREENAVFSFKNISHYPLDISSEELLERFVRGDQSRHTEGSGLGLSIAKSLTHLQQGKFELTVDGDFFKVMLQFPII